MVMITADEDDAGTAHDIELEITTVGGRRVVNHVFRGTSQDDLERAQD
jgi:hypothetical protein